MSRYLISEVHQHTCPICYEVMKPPIKSPMLLFPCGHTFCSECLEMHHRKSPSPTLCCPYCRAEVISKAINHSLQQLIDSFLSRQRELPLDNATVSVSSSIDRLPQKASRSEIDQGVDDFLQAWRSYKMREKILGHEIADTLKEEQVVSKKLGSAEVVYSVLKKDLGEAERKVKEAQEYLELVQQQEQSQRLKVEELCTQQHEIKQRGALLKVRSHPLNHTMQHSYFDCNLDVSRSSCINFHFSLLYTS
mmetsp:Transcript_39440/g.101107  ORF Transcript_39440/g.101107 Transcript_39440/m.101107 type:complete len:249 (+) Transcript_39440:512-1258(+)